VSEFLFEQLVDEDLQLFALGGILGVGGFLQLRRGKAAARSGSR
jgi:hypothetical protein